MNNSRKVDHEYRQIKKEWANLYFFIEFNGKPTCLICNKQVAVAKEYNVKRHYITNHEEKFKSYVGKLREEKILKLRNELSKRQSIFANINKKSDDSVLASFVIAKEIASSSKPFVEGEFIKKCMLKVSEIICPEKRHLFSDIALSRNTISQRTLDISENLHFQLKDKASSFLAFSIAIDESTDITDVAQLSIFIRGVEHNMTIIEELVEFVPMKSQTTGEDIFQSLINSLEKINIDWRKMESLTTDGAPQVIGRDSGVVSKLKSKLQSMDKDHHLYGVHCIIHREALCCKVLKMDHVMSVVVKSVNFIRTRALNHRQFNDFLQSIDIPCDLPYYSHVRWLSRGVVLMRFFALLDEIRIFMEMKDNIVPELGKKEWIQDLAFMVDITGHLNDLNLKLQGKNKLITEFSDNIEAFQMKLELWSNQMLNKNLCHFTTLKSLVNKENIPFKNYSSKISELRSDFEKRFTDLIEMKEKLSIFLDPFAVKVEKIPEELQLEAIELRCDSAVSNKFCEVDLKTFYQFLGDKYPKFKIFAAKIMSIFGSSFLCEQLFSLMKINKSKYRSKLTDAHLNAIMKISTTEFNPNYGVLVEQKRSQVSGSKN